MEVLRKKNILQIAVDNEADAVALYAVVYNHPEWTTPDQFARVQGFWAHFCAGVQELGLDFRRAIGEKESHLARR